MHRNDLIPSSAVAITKSDTSAVNLVGLYVGTTGDVTIQSVEGTSVTFSTVPAGAILPIRIVRVMSTGTTAGAMVGLQA